MDRETHMSLLAKAANFGVATSTTVWGLVTHSAGASKKDKSLIALIVARIGDGRQRWSHVMKLDVASKKLEHGAWTPMRITPSRCELAPGGEFWQYHATTRSRQHAFGETGATAIARVPWLTALTNIECCDIFRTVIASETALPASSQARLRAMFLPSSPSVPGVTAPDSAFRVACYVELESSEEQLAAEARAIQLKRELGANWLWAQDNITIYTTSQRTPKPLGHAGILRVLRRDKVIFEFDCSTLRPAPKQSPPSARAPLAPRA